MVQEIPCLDVFVLSITLVVYILMYLTYIYMKKLYDDFIASALIVNSLTQVILSMTSGNCPVRAICVFNGTAIAKNTGLEQRLGG
jgi:hypothetical protein